MSGAVKPVAATRLIPFGDGWERPDSEKREFTGFDVGPFFVHATLSDNEIAFLSDSIDDCDTWHVTHLESGFAVQKMVPTHARAIWLAKALSTMACFGGKSKAEVLADVTPELRAQIDVLRADAVNGDCQGTIDAGGAA